MRMNNKKTVLFVSHDAELSGASMILKECFDKWIDEKPFNIICLFPRKGAFSDYCECVGIRTIFLEYHFWILGRDNDFLNKVRLYSRLPFRYLRTRRFVDNVLRNETIDMVYSNTSVIQVGAWISRMLGVRHLWHIHEFSVGAHDAYPLLGKTGLHRYIYNNSDKIIVVSNALKAYFDEDVPDDKTVVVYNDISEIHFSKAIEKWSQIPHVGIVTGTFVKGKHQDTVIRAVKLLRDRGIDFHVKMVGAHNLYNEAYYQGIIRFISEHTLEQFVEIHDYSRNIGELRREVGFEIVASEFESFGRVTIEAMGSGLIVIGAKSGGTIELIEDEKTGFYFDLDDEKSLANRIEELLVRNVDDLNTIRNNAWEKSKGFICSCCADKISNEILKIFAYDEG